MTDSYQQRQAFFTLNANWTKEVASPLTLAEGPEEVLIGPRMNQSLWSGVCDALISQSAWNTGTTLGHDIYLHLDFWFEAGKRVDSYSSWPANTKEAKLY